MSAISSRLVPDPEMGITLSGEPWGAVMMAYLNGDMNSSPGVLPSVLRNFVNAMLTGNQAPALTTGEEADMIAMKTYFDGLNNAGKTAYIAKLIPYVNLLQEDTTGFVTETLWDNLMGL